MLLCGGEKDLRNKLSYSVLDSEANTSYSFSYMESKLEGLFLCNVYNSKSSLSVPHEEPHNRKTKRMI